MFSLSYHLQVVGLNTVSRNVEFNLLCFRAKKGDQIDDLNVGQASCLLLSIGAAALSLVTDSKKNRPDRTPL